MSISGSGASVTVKGESGSSSGASAAAVQHLSTGTTKTFAELTDEEKRRFLEIQKKHEDESKSQWGDGTYEKTVRYQNSKSITAIAGGGSNGAASSSSSSGTSIAAGNDNVAFNGGRSNWETSSAVGGTVAGPAFAVGSSAGSAVVHNNNGESSSSSVYTGSSRGQGSLHRTAGGGSDAVTASGGGSGGGHGRVEGAYSAAGEQSVYGSSDGVYGAAHFGETQYSSGSSSTSFHVAESSGGSEFRGGAHRQSSVNVIDGAESEVRRQQQQQSSSSNARGGGWSSNAAANFDGGWSSSGGGGSGGSTGSQGTVLSGGQTAVREQQKWGTTDYENRGSAGGGASGVWRTGLQQGGRNNFTSFRESESSHVVNTTWDDKGPPKTYVRNQWRTNDDGYVRNGSSTRVEDGVLDYREAINKMKTGGGAGTMGVVSSNIPGDDSDLSISVTAATERQEQGFRQAKVDESETVQKWRTVDGKLYRVKNADDWDALIAKGGSTEVYEGQEYEPQNYVKPAGNVRERDRDAQVDGKFKLYTRFKRNTETKKCGPTRCATVKCKIGPLSKDQEVWLSFRSRAWVNTLKKVKD